MWVKSRKTLWDDVVRVNSFALGHIIDYFPITGQIYNLKYNLKRITFINTLMHPSEGCKTSSANSISSYLHTDVTVIDIPTIAKAFAWSVISLKLFQICCMFSYRPFNQTHSTCFCYPACCQIWPEVSHQNLALLLFSLRIYSAGKGSLQGRTSGPGRKPNTQKCTQ